MASQNPDGTTNKPFPENENQFGVGRSINITTATGSRTMILGGSLSAAVEITSVGTGGTFKFQALVASAWVDIPSFDVVGNAAVAKGTVLAATGTWLLLGIGGMTQVQVLAQALTGGAILGTMSGSSLANYYAVASGGGGGGVVTGGVAAGSATSGAPVLVGGSDGTNVQYIGTDTSGRTKVVGPGAAGSAVVGNPVLMAGSDATNARTLLTDTSGRQVVAGGASAGTAIAGNPVLMGGSDGTNARAISTDSSGRIVVGLTTTSNVAQADGATNTVPSAGTVNMVPYPKIYNGATWDRQRAPARLITGTANQNTAGGLATGAGNTAVWTPGSGKKFNILKYMIGVVGNAATTGGGVITISLQDGSTAIGHAHYVYIPATGLAGAAIYMSPWIDLGPVGYPSSAANNVLNINLSAAVTGGVWIILMGTEE